MSQSANSRIAIHFLILILLQLKCLSAIAEEGRKDYQQTGLPVCYINHDSNLKITKENKIEAEFIIVNNNDTLKTHIKISGRGNSTWTRDKKPYNIKFEKSTSPLGLKEGKKFALLANDYDPSKMRTAIGFAVCEWVNIEWPLHGKYIELVINGVHKGNYFLCERVCTSTLNINKGFILEYKYSSQVDEEGVHFTTERAGYIMEFKDPDNPVVGTEIYNYAVSAINQLEETLYSSNIPTTQHLASKIDIDNFARWFYAKNLLQMDECNRYYVIKNYKDKTAHLQKHVSIQIF